MGLLGGEKYFLICTAIST